MWLPTSCTEAVVVLVHKKRRRPHNPHLDPETFYVKNNGFIHFFLPAGPLRLIILFAGML